MIVQPDFNTDYKSYSNQDSVIWASRYTNRSMQQTKASKYWFSTKVQRQFTGEIIVFPRNVMLGQKKNNNAK